MVNIVFITDNNYAMPTSVAITSIFANRNVNNEYCIYVVTDCLTEDNIVRLDSLNNENFRISLITSNSTPYDSIEQRTEHVSKAALIKFMLPSLLKMMDKALYLDGDVIVRGDLAELYNIDLTGYYAAVVKDANAMLHYKPTQNEKLGLSHSAYFNSGVMLLNLKRMREENLEKKLLFYRENGINYFMDQDAFNAEFHEEVKYISLYNNYMYTLRKRTDVEALIDVYDEKLSVNEYMDYEKATILHLAGLCKPWKEYVPYMTAIFRKYYEMSPYSDIELKINSEKKLSDESIQLIASKKNIHKKNEHQLFAEAEAFEKAKRCISYGLYSGNPRPYRIIISLTTVPARINDVPKVIISLLNQTMKPDKIILCLTKEEYGDAYIISDDLQLLTQYGLEIMWCEKNLFCHTKYYYTMQRYPDDIIITVDDDIYYESSLVEKLYDSYINFPNAVSANRTHLITLDDENNINPYSKWKMEFSLLQGYPSQLLFATGVGGVLYPPHIFSDEVFNINRIHQLSLKNDDIWLKFMELKSGIPTVTTGGRHNLVYVGNTQQVGLCYENTSTSRNDEYIADLIAFYNKKDSSKELLKVLADENNNKIMDVARELMIARQRIRARDRELQHIKGSISYKLGQGITWPLRQIRKIVKTIIYKVR